MPNIELNIKKLQQEIAISINTLIKDSVYPSYKDAMAYWQGICKYAMPRSFRHIIELKGNKISYSHGFEALGYDSRGPGTVTEFASIHHENLKILTDYYTLAIYKSALKFPSLFKEGGMAFCTHKAIKDVSGVYWLVYQVTTPFRYDVGGYMTSYLSQYVILGKYHGQAMETEIYFTNEHKNEADNLKTQMLDVKKNILIGLGFSKKQKLILELESAKTLKKEICKSLEISSGTLNNHRWQIIKRARVIFPLNNFRYVKDVVDYLVKQQLI